jgi:hypothetical protein
MRTHDWPQKLTAIFRAAVGRAGVYGEHDCALHAMECADAIVEGSALAADWRGAYADYIGGLRALRRRTKLRSMAAWADTLWPRVHPSAAKRGDWGMVKAAEGEALAVFDGAHLRTACGVTLPRADCLPGKAWSVE